MPDCIEFLCRDVWNVTLQYLPLAGIVSSSRVNRYWNAITQTATRGVCHEAISLAAWCKLSEAESFPTAEQAARLIARYVRHLKLSARYSRPSGHYFLSCLQHIETCGVQTLELYNVHMDQLVCMVQGVIRTCPHITAWTWKHHVQPHMSSEWIAHREQLAQHCAGQWTSLTTELPFPWSMFRGAEVRLQHLRLFCEPDYREVFTYDTDWAAFAAVCRNSLQHTLRTLDVSGLIKIEDDALLPAVQALPQLEELNVLKCTKLSCVFYSVLPALVCLHTLHAARIHQHSVQQMRSLACIPSLRRLRIMSYDLEGEWQQELVRCSTLRELVLTDQTPPSGIWWSGAGTGFTKHRLSPFHCLVQLHALRIEYQGLGSRKWDESYSTLDRTIHTSAEYNVLGEDVVALLYALPELHSLALVFRNAIYLRRHHFPALHAFSPRVRRLDLVNRVHDLAHVPVRRMRQELYPIECNESWKAPTVFRV